MSPITFFIMFIAHHISLYSSFLIPLVFFYILFTLHCLPSLLFPLILPIVFRLQTVYLPKGRYTFILFLILYSVFSILFSVLFNFFSIFTFSVVVRLHMFSSSARVVRFGGIQCECSWGAREAGGHLGVWSVYPRDSKTTRGEHVRTPLATSV